jgi:lysozyme
MFRMKSYLAYALLAGSALYACGPGAAEERGTTAECACSGNQNITSPKGIDMIKGFEGFRSTAYKCLAGVWTIGYGHTKNVKPGQQITEEEAERVLRCDLKKAESAVSEYVKVPLTVSQKDALVSFVYNVGRGNFSKSTLLKKLNECDYTGAAEEFKRWTKAGGKHSPGLENRRAKEAECFNSPVWHK